VTEGLHQMHMDDVASNLRELQSLDAPVTRQLDVWIGTLGFEDRGYAIAEGLARGNSSSRLALLCRYDTNQKDNEAQEERLLAEVDRFAETREWLDADKPVFPGQLRMHLQDLQQQLGQALRIGWDISVASNQLILSIGQILLEGDGELEIFYTEAETYFPTKDEYEADPGRWTGEDRMGLERGTLNVRTSSAYPGEHSAQLANRLLIIPGYNRDRVRKVISNVDSQFLVEPRPAPITWFVGRPHAPHDAWREKAVREIHNIPADHEDIPVSTFDYREMLLALERIYAIWGLKSNITLAPMGSKMQAFGCILFCFARPDVRVLFAQPEEYNASRYTKGTRALWSIEVGRLENLTGQLLNVGTLVRLD